MARLKQAFAWGAFHRAAGTDADPAALIAAAARIGYAGVEMPPEALWPTIQAHGLTIATVVGHQSLSDGLNRRANQDRIANEIAANLEKAVAHGIPNLIVFSGNRGDLTDDEGTNATIDCLRRVAPLAESAGVTLVMELLNSKVNHPDYQADRTAWGVRVCQSVGSPRVKLLYDIYHMQVMEGDIIATLRDNIAQIAHIHTAGVPGRRDIDETQELYYPAIARAIAATEYEGFVGHEFTPKGDPVAALEAAFRTCDVAGDAPVAP